jgi:ankyrin repeat protein
LLTANGANLNMLEFIEYRRRKIYPTEYLFKKPEITNIILETAPDSLFENYSFYDNMLYHFIEINDSNQIKKLLNRTATINKPILNGVKFPSIERQQPIYYCTDSSLFKFLVNNGAQIKNIDNFGNDAHLLTFGWKNISLINWLEKKGLPIQKPNNSYFVTLKDTTFMLYLMNRGVSINSVDNYGNTALIRAKHFDNNPALENFLLRHGADKNILNKKGGSYYIGRTSQDNYQASVIKNKNSSSNDNCPETIYSVTEEIPSYKNGIEDLKKYFQTAINLSDNYKTGEYRIAFEFIVDCNGKANIPHFLNTKYSDINNNIKDAILKMGKWNAAKMLGKQVRTRVKYVLNISNGTIDLKENS